MGDLIGLAHTQPLDKRALGPEADVIGVLARRGRKPPHPVEVLKYDLARLLPDNGVQPARQVPDLCRKDYTQGDLT
jgi:hypothetical protein